MSTPGLYTVTHTYGISNMPGSQWMELSISTMPVNQIFTKFRRVYITVTMPSVPNPYIVDMDSMRAQYSASTLSLQDLFTSFGNMTLSGFTLLNTLPVLTSPVYAAYADAFRAGYKVDMVNSSNQPTTNISQNQNVKARLYRPGIPGGMQNVYNNCLVSINGFFHRTETDTNFLYVNDAGMNLYRSHSNQIGLFNFAKLGGIQIVPITNSMIYSQGSGSFLSQRAYVNLGVDTSNKTVIFVLGGYLNFMQDGGFFRSGDNTFCINFANLPVVERFYESQPYLDYFKYLGLTPNAHNTTQIDLAQFYSDPVLIKYLTSSNSFAVIVNTPSVFVSQYKLSNSTAAGSYISYVEPTYPLMVGYGRVAEYWKTYSDKQWLLNVNDSLQNNYLFKTATKANLATLSGQQIPNRPVANSPGYLLGIGKDISA